MRWRDDYRAKCVTAAQAVQVIRSGQLVLLEGGGALPQTLVEALVADHARLNNVRLLTHMIGSWCPYARREYADSFRAVSFTPNAQLREAMRAHIVGP